jgi:hypothetical protein
MANHAVRTFQVGSRELTAPILEEILFRGFLAEPVVGKIAEEPVILSSVGSRDYPHRLCQLKLTLHAEMIEPFKAHGGRLQSDLKQTCVPMKSLICFRSLLLYRNYLSFRALLDQPVYRFDKKPFHHPDQRLIIRGQNPLDVIAQSRADHVNGWRLFPTRQL